MSILVYKERLFMLQTKAMSYVLCVDQNGLVKNLYWGNRIERPGDFENFDQEEEPFHCSVQEGAREECSSFGGLRFKETSMKVTFEDGVRDFRYRVKGYRTDGDHLILTLEDIHYPLRIRLHYRVYEENDIIEKWREAENSGVGTIVLERFYSAEFGLPGTGYESVNYNGRWGAEFRKFSEPVDCGKKVYESLYGLTAHTVSPFFVVHRNADEDSGEVYYGVLKYSGNFKVVVEATPRSSVNILIGISDTDFKWKLKPGEVFTTPSVFAGHSSSGFDAMSNNLSRFSRARIMPRAFAERTLPVLYNSWYSTLFDVRCNEQIALAERAARMGVELFVVDDGWFQGRDTDRAGLGDWSIDRKKFPDGLAPLIRRVNELGMRFGLWIEPEMVNPNSNLYRKHPDWIYHYQTRESLLSRHQVMLDMTNPAVIRYLIDSIDALLTENNISYIKWDMNRYASEMASDYQAPDAYQSMWYRNTEGVYAVIRALREKYPEVEFEACASGGGRVDYGAMEYFDEYWPSDNTDPLDRLSIQEGYSLVYPVKYMRAWLTSDDAIDGRKIPLSFGMHCAMCGSLGIGIDLNKAPEEELARIRQYIAEYKSIREIVQLGDLHRLKSFGGEELHAVQYCRGDRSAVFAFLRSERYESSRYRLHLKGLDPTADYRFSLDGKEEIRSGACLMYVGLALRLTGDYDSKLICLTKCGQDRL